MKYYDNIISDCKHAIQFVIEFSPAMCLFLVYTFLPIARENLVISWIASHEVFLYVKIGGKQIEFKNIRV